MPDVVGFATARLAVGEEARRLALEREVAKRRAHLGTEGILAVCLAVKHTIKARREGSMLPSIGGNKTGSVESASSAIREVSLLNAKKKGTQ